jgi:hypothetical protein
MSTPLVLARLRSDELVSQLLLLHEIEAGAASDAARPPLSGVPLPMLEGPANPLPMFGQPDPQPSTAATGAEDDAEHCGLCGLPIPDQHRHVLDVDRHELHCACRACSILFDHSGAGGHHYRLIPDRRDVLEVDLDDLAWRALGIPVEMAFFVRESETERVRAFYPSPAGATESELPLEAWGEIETANPALAELESDVEALLVNRTGPATEAFVVGIDQCYRLVAVVRTHWQGFTGGAEVWREIEDFFSRLRAGVATGAR